MHLLGVNVDGVSSPGPNISTAPGINALDLIWLFCLFQKCACFCPNPYFYAIIVATYVMMRRSVFLQHLHLCHLTSTGSPSLTRSLSCQPLLWPLHLSHVNLVIPHILQLHHLSEEGWGLCQEKLASTCHPTIPASSFCQPA